MNDVKLDNVQLVKHLVHILTSDLTSCIRRPYITERRMQCCHISNSSVVIYVSKLCNPTVAVFMEHSYGIYPIRILTDQVYHGEVKLEKLYIFLSELIIYI